MERPAYKLDTHIGQEHRKQSPYCSPTGSGPIARLRHSQSSLERIELARGTIGKEPLAEVYTTTMPVTDPDYCCIRDHNGYQYGEQQRNCKLFPLQPGV